VDQLGGRFDRKLFLDAGPVVSIVLMLRPIDRQSCAWLMPGDELKDSSSRSLKRATECVTAFWPTEKGLQARGRGAFR